MFSSKTFHRLLKPESRDFHSISMTKKQKHLETPVLKSLLVMTVMSVTLVVLIFLGLLRFLILRILYILRQCFSYAELYGQTSLTKKYTEFARRIAASALGSWVYMSG